VTSFGGVPGGLKNIRYAHRIEVGGARVWVKMSREKNNMVPEG